MNLGVNHRYTYGYKGIINFGGGEYASRRANLGVNHRNTHGNMRIGDLGCGEYASRGMNLD